jgi:eukaryotic-like serine/threonine-protein kinase
MAETVLAHRYRLDKPLGGTMSEVYLAEDLELGRPVVVKLLGPDAERVRFEREAHAAAALSHEDIVLIYAYGETDDGRPFMVLEHLAGGTLEERLADGPLADDETLRIAREIAAGLAHAHARGLVHRDLKPANVLFDDEGRAKISDFGIARLGGAGTITEAGTVLGTAAYISPEQAAGEQATPASDVYSFGVMLFRMLTGRLPFVEERPAELVRMHQRDAPPNVSELRPDLPARIESLVAATLAKDPADRPRDGAALLAELGAQPAGEQTEALPAQPTASPRRRVPLPLAAGVLAVLAAGGVALALVATHDGSPGSSTSNAVRTHTPRTPTPTARTHQPLTPPATTTAPTVKQRETTTAGPPTPTTAPATTTEPVETEPVTLPATTAVTATTTVTPPTPPPTPGG